MGNTTKCQRKGIILKREFIAYARKWAITFVQRDGTTFQKESELGFSILYVDGHTDKMMIPHIQYKGKTLVFMADLLPTVGHIPLPYVMGFDTRPLLTLDEKALFLQQAVENEYLLFFQHDAHNELCTLENTEKGVRLNEIYSFKEIFES